MKFLIKNFFSKCDQIHSFLRIWSHLLKKSLIEKFISRAVASVRKQLFLNCLEYVQKQQSRGAYKKIPTKFSKKMLRSFHLVNFISNVYWSKNEIQRKLFIGTWTNLDKTQGFAIKYTLQWKDALGRVLRMTTRQ